MNKIMKKNHFSLWRKARLLSVAAVGALLLSSCAQDGFDDEKYDNGVYNTQLEAPSADDITVTASPDGSQQTISWPVVFGAGGYHVVLENSSSGELVVDSVFDGTSFATARIGDTNYKLSLSVEGNEDRGNIGSEPVIKEFNTFTPAFASIPAGQDIAAWFDANPIPSDAPEGELCYDLEPGGEYTMSKSIDFLGNQVTLRTADKKNPATVTMTANASFMTYTGMTLKYLNIDCTASAEPLIKLSANPDESIKGVISGSNNYYDIQLPITIDGCNVENMRGTLFYDNKLKYGLNMLLITNSVIHLAFDGVGKVNDQAVIDAYNGYINTFTIQNSTVWNSGATDAAKYFVRYNNSGRCDRAGYSACYVNFNNNTLYNLFNSEGQMCNYSALAGRADSNYSITNNIFVGCGAQVARRIVAGRLGSGPAKFLNNTYMDMDGAFQSVDGSCAGYDDSGTAIEEEPDFADVPNGNFSISASKQAQLGTGDPRWLPAN